MLLLNKQTNILRRGAALFCIAAIFYTHHAAAQPVDSLSLMRRFATISNAYKKLPVHLAITMQKSADIVLNATDTAKLQSEVFEYKEGAYIKMGGSEQIANDSLMLFIQNGIKRMSMYKAKMPTISQANGLGISIADSSIKKMNKAYIVEILPLLHSNTTGQDTAVMQLTSRRLVPGTSLPTSIMKLIYNPATGLPLMAVQTTRQLVKIDSATYASYSKNPLYSGKLITLPGTWPKGGNFLLREKTATYAYSDISFDNSKALPLQIQDCVEKNPAGQYITTERYGQYTLKLNY